MKILLDAFAHSDFSTTALLELAAHEVSVQLAEQQ